MFLRFSRSISCAVDNVILYLQLNVKDFGEFQVFAFFEIRKVFSALSKVENVAVFNESRTTTTATPVLGIMVTHMRTPYLCGCGVRIVYSIRVCHNLLLDKRNGSTLSFYMNNIEYILRKLTIIFLYENF